ncbi:efflux transporter outer membrane subunit [Methylophilaceae bacterium]|nr:efflux transporter outer membrane subunit [Methylophilaceae bacterium]
MILTKNITKTYLKALSQVVIILFLVSCKAVGPDYEGAPELEVPENWENQLDNEFIEISASQTKWWTLFKDPVLNDLISRAAVDNLDAKISLARVKVARANLGIAEGAQSPALDGLGDVSEKSKSKSVSGDKDTDIYSSIGLDISWEIDIFGYLRRSIEAADAQLDRSVERYRDVMVILYAEIANNYVALRTAQERLQYAFENVKSQKDTLRIVNARYEAELVSEVDLLQSEQNLAAAQSNIPLFHARINELSNSLAILLGKNPGTLNSELKQSYGIPHVPEKTVVQVPREILRQRPDIREAERLLAQETAEVGIATAEEYPRFNLNGTFGYDSKEFDNQFSSDSRYWSFGPNFRWNIFDGGATQAAIEVQDAQVEEARVNYEKRVLRAFEEVENAIKSYKEEKQRNASLNVSVSAAKKVNKITLARYTSGLIDFQEVQDAERVIFFQEDDLAKSNGNLVQFIIQLYKAMGGGWEDTETATEIIVNEQIQE